MISLLKLKKYAISEINETGGAFQFENLRVVASAGEGWDHVSVSTQDRCPTWPEMCFVKDAFFDLEECVMQYHPRQSQYVNFHPYCLHLWRPQGIVFPEPPTYMIGPT